MSEVFVAVETGYDKRIQFVNAKSKEDARKKVSSGYDKLYTLEDFNQTVKEKLSLEKNSIVGLAHLS